MKWSRTVPVVGRAAASDEPELELRIEVDEDAEGATILVRIVPLRVDARGATVWPWARFPVAHLRVGRRADGVAGGQRLSAAVDGRPHHDWTLRWAPRAWYTESDPFGRFRAVVACRIHTALAVVTEGCLDATESTSHVAAALAHLDHCVLAPVAARFLARIDPHRSAVARRFHPSARRFVLDALLAERDPVRSERLMEVTTRVPGALALGAALARRDHLPALAAAAHALVDALAGGEAPTVVVSNALASWTVALDAAAPVAVCDADAFWGDGGGYQMERLVRDARAQREPPPLPRAFGGPSEDGSGAGVGLAQVPLPFACRTSAARVWRAMCEVERRRLLVTWGAWILRAPACASPSMLVASDARAWVASGWPTARRDVLARGYWAGWGPLHRALPRGPFPRALADRLRPGVMAFVLAHARRLQEGDGNPFNRVAGIWQWVLRSRTEIDATTDPAFVRRGVRKMLTDLPFWRRLGTRPGLA